MTWLELSSHAVWSVCVCVCFHLERGGVRALNTERISPSSPGHRGIRSRGKRECKYVCVCVCEQNDSNITALHIFEAKVCLFATILPQQKKVYLDFAHLKSRASIVLENLNEYIFYT